MRIVFLTLLLFASEVFACSCAGSDLQGFYESSTNVFTAVVTGARFDADGDIEADFEVTEVFKGDIPFDKLWTTRSGSSCDTTITVGPEYIFFTGDGGGFGMCSGNQVIVPGQPTPWLDILRAYKAGKTPDLSSPWILYDYAGTCVLRSDFRSTNDRVISHLDVVYRYAQSEHAGGSTERRNEAGYSSAVFMLPTRQEPMDAKVSIKTVNREFTARWSDDALPFRTRGAFQLSGDDVQAFAEELLVTQEVRIEGSLTRYPSLEDTVIRTTHAGDAILEFLACAGW